MKYKAILFDLDDTLLKTSTVKWAHHKAVAKRFYDIDLTNEVLSKHWGMPLEPMMAIFYQNADTPENMLKANLSLEDEFPKELQADALKVVDTLLKSGIEVGIVTSILGHLAKKDLLRLGFPADKFFLLQGADDESAHKPDPRVFNKALKLLETKGITPEEVMYVGDALMDYYAARDAGIGFTGVTTGFVTKEQFEKEGAHAASSLTALLSAIQKP
jgi:HAD superfamily hydrolase (TIGR01549 family)